MDNNKKYLVEFSNVELEKPVCSIEICIIEKIQSDEFFEVEMPDYKLKYKKRRIGNNLS